LDLIELVFDQFLTRWPPVTARTLYIRRMVRSEYDYIVKSGIGRGRIWAGARQLGDRAAHLIP
jgi:hypothetical protein